MLDVADLQGITVREALDGNRGPRHLLLTGRGGRLRRDPHRAGRILEREGISIGLVDSSWYTQKLDIEVLGEQSHTGATAMADRHDALVAASKIILMVHDVTAEFAEEPLAPSVGQLTLEPELAHSWWPAGSTSSPTSVPAIRTS